MIVIRRGLGENHNIWIVGCYEPNEPDVESLWTPLRECDTVEEAMEWLSYVNGGARPTSFMPHRTVAGRIDR
jgi:hypothetical protein